jgi:DNA-binding winged helix-turn-helix (wHTH) protein
MTAHKRFVFTFADVEVREREFCIVRAGKVLPVEPKAFRVLLFLLRSPHRLIAKDELLDAVWNDCSVSENSLTRSIALLRRLLGDDIHEPRYIATVPTIGYRFLCDVKAADDGFGELRMICAARIAPMDLRRTRERMLFKSARRINRSRLPSQWKGKRRWSNDPRKDGAMSGDCFFPDWLQPRS